MEEEQKAASKRNQEEFSVDKRATFNPRMVNSWLQNVDGVSPVKEYLANSYQNGFIQASLPNGFVRQGHQNAQRKRHDEFPDPANAKSKSRAESYHHSYNRQDLMASHRENWDLVRQRSQSTDAITRKDQNRQREDEQTFRSTKDLREFYNPRPMYPDLSQMYPSMQPENTYDINGQNERDRQFYSDYERSPRKKIDTYESVVTERDARESDYELYRDRDEPRFRTHRQFPADTRYDRTTETENMSKTERRRRSGTRDINDEVDRILKERNKDNWEGAQEQQFQKEMEEKTYKEKEKVEMRNVQKLWAINDEFQKNLENMNEVSDAKEPERQNQKDRQNQKENYNQETDEPSMKDKKYKHEDKEYKIDGQKQNHEDSRVPTVKSKSTKETKETKKSRIKYENRVFLDQSKHKSKKKESKKAKRLSSKTSSTTRNTQETIGSFRESELPIQDGRTEFTATPTEGSSPMKRYDSQIDKRYSQFDKYTNSDVYPRTPEPSSMKDSVKQGDIENVQIKARKEEGKERSKSYFGWSDKNTENKDNDVLDTGMAKSVKSISSRPTVDSRTVKLNKKEGGASGNTFSVLAGDIGMMEQFQNLSGKLVNHKAAVQVG